MVRSVQTQDRRWKLSPESGIAPPTLSHIAPGGEIFPAVGRSRCMCAGHGNHPPPEDEERPRSCRTYGYPALTHALLCSSSPVGVEPTPSWSYRPLCHDIAGADGLTGGCTFPIEVCSTAKCGRHSPQNNPATTGPRTLGAMAPPPRGTASRPVQSGPLANQQREPFRQVQRDPHPRAESQTLQRRIRWETSRRRCAHDARGCG